MYRQRKRDLNLKPNRQLDKRSSRGMIYENEELRMRTIAICEDVDRGQTDIKKLKKENDHLKREIWGLRDECEKLEEMLKKVCISANIPEIQLEARSRDDEDDDEDDDCDKDGDDEDYRGAGKHSSRARRESGASVMTYDSEVGSCGTMSLFSDEDGKSEDIAFALDLDTSSVINHPGINENVTFSTTEAIVEQQPPPPQKSVAFDFERPHTSWGHAAIPPDLECVREETESTTSALNSPDTFLPPGPGEEGLYPLTISTGGTFSSSDNFDVLPDPDGMAILPGTSAEGLKRPMIQITPANSPIPNLDSQSSEMNVPSSDVVSSELPPEGGTVVDADAHVNTDTVQSMGCMANVPKTFKVTSEIVVGNEAAESSAQEEKDLAEALALANNFSKPPLSHGALIIESKSVELPRKNLSQKHKLTKKHSDPTIPASTSSVKGTTPRQLPTDQIVINGLGCHRRSCYLPASGGYPSSTFHRSFGMLGCCCTDYLNNGCQSEPSLNSPSTGAEGGGGFISHSAEEYHPANFFNGFCCPNPIPPVTPAVALRSVWNSVDKNIVIGFYDTLAPRTTSANASDPITPREPKVQELIDELECQFDPTLENITGIRTVPGRIFVSLKNASIVKAFLHQFKNDLQLPRNNLKVYFIEGCSKWSTLVLSGIPQDVNDLAVISTLNQFGQVVAPLERRNYKGVDISERIAKMHLVISESSVPESVNVSGYDVRIRVEPDPHQPTSAADHLTDTNKLLKHGQGGGDITNSCGGVGVGVLSKTAGPITQKYGFVAPTAQPVNAATGASCSTVSPQAPSSSSLKPHKPVIRSSSSAPRLETPAQGTQLSLPNVEAKRQSSVCVASIPPDQHPSKLGTITQQSQKTLGVNAPPTTQAQQQASSTPNLQHAPKKPLARLMVSSPGSFQPSPMASPQNPFDNYPVPKVDSPQGPGGALKAFYRNFDPRRGSGQTGKSDGRGGGSHALLTPCSSYSPKSRRKSSVQFASSVGKGGKREPLPWCGCWGLGCG